MKQKLTIEHEKFSLSGSLAHSMKNEAQIKRNGQNVSFEFKILF